MTEFDDIRLRHVLVNARLRVEYLYAVLSFSCDLMTYPQSRRPVIDSRTIKASTGDQPVFVRCVAIGHVITTVVFVFSILRQLLLCSAHDLVESFRQVVLTVSVEFDCLRFIYNYLLIYCLRSSKLSSKPSARGSRSFSSP